MALKTHPDPQTPSPLTFSESVMALEHILQRFRQGTLPLEEGLMLFEQGVQHIQNCQSKLNTVKGQINLLTETLQAIPFDETISGL